MRFVGAFAAIFLLESGVDGVTYPIKGAIWRDEYAIQDDGSGRSTVTRTLERVYELEVVIRNEKRYSRIPAMSGPTTEEHERTHVRHKVEMAEAMNSDIGLWLNRPIPSCCAKLLMHYIRSSEQYYEYANFLTASLYHQYLGTEINVPVATARQWVEGNSDDKHEACNKLLDCLQENGGAR